MNLGLRQTLFSKPFNVQSYIQDGLIAHWDGIDNAGIGIHDSNSTIWKNLVGEDDAFPVVRSGATTDNPTTPIWHDDSVYFDGLYLFRINSLFNKPQHITIEICFHAIPYNNQLYAGYAALVDCTEGYGGVGIYQKATTLQWVAAVGNPSGGYYEPEILIPVTNVKQTISFSVGTSRNIYRDAILLNSEGGANGIQYNYNYMYIGASVGNWSTLLGNIYSVRIYNRDLSKNEIQHNITIDKARFNL